MVTVAHPAPHAKRHLDRSSRFATIHRRDQQTSDGHRTDIGQTMNIASNRSRIPTFGWQPGPNNGTWSVDVFATFDSFRSCSHLHKSASCPIKSVRKVLINTFRRGLVGFVSGFHSRRRGSTPTWVQTFLAMMRPFIELLRSLVSTNGH